MSSTKHTPSHTPEPWNVLMPLDWWRGHKHYNAIACAIEGQCTLPGSGKGETWEVAAFDAGERADPPDDIDEFTAALQRANAARAVSCVNAMQGIDDPAAFRKCFEEMVKVCESLFTKCESTHVVYGHGDNGDVLSYDEPLRRASRAALQSAKSLSKRGA